MCVLYPDAPARVFLTRLSQQTAPHSARTKQQASLCSSPPHCSLCFPARKTLAPRLHAKWNERRKKGKSDRKPRVVTHEEVQWALLLLLFFIGATRTARLHLVVGQGSALTQNTASFSKCLCTMLPTLVATVLFGNTANTQEVHLKWLKRHVKKQKIGKSLKSRKNKAIWDSNKSKLKTLNFGKKK